MTNLDIRMLLFSAALFLTLAWLAFDHWAEKKLQQRQHNLNRQDPLS